MIKDNELFEVQLNVIGFLLKNIEDIDKLSITKD